MPRWMLVFAFTVACGTSEPPEEEPAPIPEAPAEAPEEEDVGSHHEGLRLRAAGDLARAAAVFEAACDEGSLPSCVAFAEMLENGDGVEAQPERARGVYAQACDEGSTLACDRLGH
jgi:TPR repeat protein